MSHEVAYPRSQQSLRKKNPLRTRLNAIAAAVIVGLGLTACGGWLADWLRTLSEGVMQPDSRKLVLALNRLVPVSSARAAPMRFAKARRVADLRASDGVGVSADLDAPSGSNTVAQELASRGFSIPGYY